MRYVVAYDISDDGARAKLAAVLSAWGDRIQRSVFECTLSVEELDGLMRRATPFVNVERDSLHVVPVCQNCASTRLVVGQAIVPTEDPFWIV